MYGKTVELTSQAEDREAGENEDVRRVRKKFTKLKKLPCPCPRCSVRTSQAEDHEGGEVEGVDAGKLKKPTLKKLKKPDRSACDK